MKFVALFFVSVTLYAQQSTGPAATKGTCSPATTGNQNTFNFTCSGLTPAQQKLLESIPALLNKLLDSQTDNTAEILSRLDACVAGVNQVKEQQTPWRLPDDQQTTLRGLLSGHHADVSVHVIPQDRNASLFGADLLLALREYSTAPEEQKFNSDFRLSPQIEGIVVMVSHQDFPEARFLQQALHTATGINIQGYVDTAGTFAKGDSIVIAVGAKPSALR
jgi:hypothetical protein